jgi:class 3 adenylate cyclase
MEVVKECLTDAANLSVAIGIDYGTTLVSKLGSRGARDRICLGDAVEQAAKIEERVEGTDTGISTEAHTQLPGHIGDLFHWKKTCSASSRETSLPMSSNVPTRPTRSRSSRPRPSIAAPQGCLCRS